MSKVLTSKITKRPSQIRMALAGGLGNQIFIYFAGLYRARSLGSNLGLVNFTRENEFSLAISNFQLKGSVTNASRLDRLLIRVGQSARAAGLCSGPTSMRNYFSPEIGFDEELLFIPRNVLAHGFYQSYKYFNCLEISDRQLDLISETAEYRNLCLAFAHENPVMVHIRRGDYLIGQHPQTFGVLDDQYFMSALDDYLQKDSNRPVWFFSDSPEELSKLQRIYSKSRVINKLSAAESLKLMSQANSIVTSNSSFSFWAAMLGNQKKDVIAPRAWFRSLPKFDPAPPHWKRLDSKWAT